MTGMTGMTSKMSYKHRSLMFAVFLIAVVLILGGAVYSAVRCEWDNMGIAITFSIIGSIFSLSLGFFVYNFVMYWKKERNLQLPLYVSPTEKSMNYHDTFW